jgi:hypothetical protein
MQALPAPERLPHPHWRERRETTILGTNRHAKSPRCGNRPAVTWSVTCRCRANLAVTHVRLQRQRECTSGQSKREPSYAIVAHCRKPPHDHGFSCSMGIRPARRQQAAPAACDSRAQGRSLVSHTSATASSALFSLSLISSITSQSMPRACPRNCRKSCRSICSACLPRRCPGSWEE